MTDAAYPPLSCRLYVCETCGTFSEDDPLPRHAMHNVIAMEGEDYDKLTRTAAAHIVLATHVRKGWEPDGMVAKQMADARIHADWFSESDSVYDDDAANR